MSADRRPARRPAVRRKPAARKPSAAAQALATLPVGKETLRRMANYGAIGAVLAVFVVGAMAMSLPQMIGTEIGELVGRAGFAVRHIDVHGRSKEERDAVMRILADQRSRAMPLVDLGATRDRLLGLGWIADASVSRRLPDTLVVEIIERRQSAIWQYRGKLALIDKSGAVIAPVSIADMPTDLPILIGPGANRKLEHLDTLIEHAPSLKPMLAAATWVGERRWDLRFQSGETLSLPEGEDAAATALEDFARRDAEHRLLGQGLVRFDMRVPGRLVVRVSREPGRSITDDLEAPPGNDDT